jgi:DNA-directed RNA polymerase subunit D
MKLILDKKQENRLEVIAKDMSTSMANMVRRYSLSRIPVLAIESVTFYDNSTAFWDEYVAHRLGLFPIMTPENLPESTEVVFTLDAEGPKVAYASDMASTDKEISVAKPSIPIVTLGPNQHLRFEAKAVLGTAKKHAKYQAGLVTYGDEGGSLRLIVESFFQMRPADVVLRACSQIEMDIEAVEYALGRKSERMKKAEKEAAKAAEKAAKEAEKAEKAAAKAAKEAEKAAAEETEKAEKPKKAKAPKAKKAKAAKGDAEKAEEPAAEPEAKEE